MTNEADDSKNVDSKPKKHKKENHDEKIKHKTPEGKSVLGKGKNKGKNKYTKYWKTLQILGLPPNFFCSETVALPPVKAFHIFLFTTSGASIVKIEVSGSEALIFPPFPRPGRKRQ